jgi:hypothetical protein
MSEDDIQRRAYELAKYFDDMKYLEFYIKCVKILPEGRIQYLLEVSKTKNKPMFYFKKAAKVEINKLIDDGDYRDGTI